MFKNLIGSGAFLGGIAYDQPAVCIIVVIVFLMMKALEGEEE